MLHIRCVKINRHFPQTRHQMYLISAMCLCVRCFPASAHLTSVDGWFAVFWMRCFKAGKHLKHAGQCTLRTRVGGENKTKQKNPDVTKCKANKNVHHGYCLEKTIWIWTVIMLCIPYIDYFMGEHFEGLLKLLSVFKINILLFLQFLPLWIDTE